MNTKNVEDNRMYFVRWVAEDGNERQLNYVSGTVVKSIEQESEFDHWTMLKDWYTGENV